MGVTNKPRKRIWVQQVAVEADAYETRVKVARAKGLASADEPIAEGVIEHVRRARDAALREDPIPGRWGNWIHGTLVEVAYRRLHAARAQLIELYDVNELYSEIPAAVARAQFTLHRDDPRQISVADLSAEPVERLRPRLRRLLDDSYESLDRQFAQLRSFRNIVLSAALVIGALTTITIIVVALHPSVMPLCFPKEVITGTSPIVTEAQGQNCPTSSGTRGPSGGDILVVALLGLLGGALTASVSIRRLRGTSTPYDVPVALAMLKVPLGAFTAILALVAIQGDFVPGLTVLDSQEQILAYALIFGFAQQVFTRLLDNKAQDLLEGLPNKDASTPPPRPLDTHVQPAGERPSNRGDTSDEALGIPPDTSTLDTPVEPHYLPNPEGDDEAQTHDDETSPLPDPPERDDR